MSSAPPGTGEVFRVIADRTGVARSVRLYLDQDSEASELVLALYGERQGEEPAALLATGRNANPLAGGWNAVELESGVPLVAGQPYWIGLLNPLGSDGPLRWRDRAGDVGTAERVSLSTTLTALPASWTSSASLVGRAAVGLGVGHPGGRARAHADARRPRPRRPPEPSATAQPTRRRRRPRPRPPSSRRGRRPPPARSRPGASTSARAARSARAASRAASAARSPSTAASRSPCAARRPSRALTVEAWVRPEARDGHDRRAERLGPDAGRGLRRTADGPGGALKLRRWSHLALTYDGRTIRRYVDGRPAGTRAYSGTLGGGSTLRIGDGFRGRLDELRLYDRALTAAEIRADMGNAVKP